MLDSLSNQLCMNCLITMDLGERVERVPLRESSHIVARSWGRLVNYCFSSETSKLIMAAMWWSGCNSQWVVIWGWSCDGTIDCWSNDWLGKLFLILYSNISLIFHSIINWYRAHCTFYLKTINFYLSCYAFIFYDIGTISCQPTCRFKMLFLSRA